MIFSKPTTFAEAMAYLNRKAILPTTGSSLDLQKLPSDIRNRSLFSARTAYVSHLSTLDSVLAGIIAPPDTTAPDYMPGAYMNPAKAKMILRQSLQGLGYDPAKADVTPGSLKDLSSDRRIDLMIEMNTREIRGYGQYAQGRASQELLNEFPAQELIRVMDRNDPRDWQKRWVRKGGKLADPENGDDRMIALKTDPIWTKISAFNRPFPPFDFGSGMGVRDIDRDEAIDLGIMQPDTILTPDIQGLNDNLSLPTSAQSRSALADAIRNVMGDNISFGGGVLRFLTKAIQQVKAT